MESYIKFGIFQLQINSNLKNRGKDSKVLKGQKS